jgi:hypothetical protein
VILGAALALALVAPAKVSLTASPAHVVLAGSDHQAVRVESVGPSVAVSAAVAGYTLDLRGRPRIIGNRRDAAPWISVRPRHAVVGRGGALLTVASKLPADARPGDHDALVLLTATAAPSGGVAVRMRIGIVVSVQVAGRVVRRLEVSRLRLLRGRRVRTFELLLQNRGSVTESITPRSLVVTLLREQSELARLQPPLRTILPHSRALLDLRYLGRARGRVTARVELVRPGGFRVVRLFHLRL